MAIGDRFCFCERAFAKPAVLLAGPNTRGERSDDNDLRDHSNVHSRKAHLPFSLLCDFFIMHRLLPFLFVQVLGGGLEGATQDGRSRAVLAKTLGRESRSRPRLTPHHGCLTVIVQP